MIIKEILPTHILVVLHIFRLDYTNTTFRKLTLLLSTELWKIPCLARYKGLSCTLGRPVNKRR